MYHSYMRRLAYSLGLSLCFYRVSMASPTEQFEEELSLRPLRDGKLAARFTFSTLANSASPRNPETLADDDDCTCSRSPFELFE